MRRGMCTSVRLFFLGVLLGGVALGWCLMFGCVVVVVVVGCGVWRGGGVGNLVGVDVDVGVGVGVGAVGVGVVGVILAVL